MQQDGNAIHEDNKCLKLEWLRMPKKDVGVDVKDCYNSLENYNSSVRVLRVDVRDWLENVER